VLAFHHVAIQCVDLERSERFYREVLGLSVLRRWPLPGGGGDRSVWLSVGGSEGGFLALERAGSAATPRLWRDGTPGLHLVALAIDPGERPAFERRLAAFGVEVVHRTRWTIYFRDPEGNRVGLTHYPRESQDSVTGSPPLFVRRRYHEDNYLYLLAEGGDAALVDPGDPEVALAAAEELGVRPRWILHTHGHADHTGGSERLRERLGARVLGHSADGYLFLPDEDLSARGELRLGALELRVQSVPGHTPGSVLLEWRGRLFTGDTLFAMGCGNCRHGGDPVRLAASFLGPIAALPGTLEVHPGHDYAARNLPFALSLEPGGAAAARGEALLAARRAGREPEPVTLAEERATNPFLRLDAPGVAAALAREAPGARTDLERFVALRALRDRA